MLVGNNEIIMAPVRDINAKVEVLVTSTDSVQGQAIRMNGCVGGAPLNIYVDASGPEGMVVSRYGKNLFDYTEYPFSNSYISWQSGITYGSNNYSATLDYIPCSFLQGATITINHPSGEYGGIGAYGTNAGIAFYDIDKVYITGTNGYTIIVPEGADYFRFSVPRAYADGTQIQIELGDTVTDYEPYKEPVSVSIGEDGYPVEEGLTSLATNTILLTDNPEVIEYTIHASYSIEAAGDTFSCVDRLKSITIDRAGENKFFGFGICQKANIKIIDINRNYGFTTNDKFNIYFNDVKVSPQMRVSEVHRDENTNELSITTYDVIKDADDYTVAELALPDSYTIGELALAVASKLKIVVVLPALEEFNILFEAGANFDGAETLREVLNAIAEATQTIYYMNAQNELVFKRLDIEGSPALTIDKEQYITLKTKDNRRLTAICSATELGDNYEATTGLVGTTQYVRNNPLWELREDITALVDNAVAAVGNMTITQFDCSWRGNYLLEPGDKIALITKENGEVYSYLVNDTVSYNGAYSQHSLWEYADEEVEHANPTNLGEALKQTYAKVDKANKEIEIVVGEAATNKQAIAQLQLDTDSINASVSNVQTALIDGVDNINKELATITEKVNATMSSEEIKIEIQNEVARGADTITTAKGYSFNDEGLKITSSESDISTVITEDGMTVKQGSKNVLIADNEGVKAADLQATTFLIIGKYSRIQDYPGQKRTACYWLG